MAYQAGNLDAPNIQTWRMTFDAQEWLLEAVQLALSSLLSSDNWEQNGDVTPDDAAELAQNIMWTFFPSVLMLGVVLPFAGASGAIPVGTLLCDGASYLRADYADLYALIGNTYGSADIAHFNVPDLRGRTVVSAGTGAGLSPRALAATFGEETHTLTIAELAGHDHSIPGTITGLAVQPGDLPTLDPGIIPGSTGSTGGDTAHNNMQPSIALNYVIVYVP